MTVGVVRWGNLRIDLTRSALYVRNDEKPITGIPGEILVYMMEHYGHWVTGSHRPDWKALNIPRRNKRFSDQIHILRKLVGPPYDKRDIVKCRKPYGEVGELAYKFVGETDPALINLRVSEPQSRERLTDDDIRSFAEDLCLDAEQLVSDVTNFQSEPNRVEFLREMRATASKIRKERVVPSFLRKYYGDASLRQSGLACFAFSVDGQDVVTNIAVPSAGIRRRIDLERAQNHGNYSFSGQVPDIPKVDNTQLARYLADSRLLNTDVFNDPVLCLRNWTSADLSQMTFGRADYLQYRLSAGRLNAELVEAFRDSEMTVQKALDKRDDILPRRKDIMRTARRIIDGGSRLCVGGVNVLFAMRRLKLPNKDDYMFFIFDRSDDVASAQGEQSVIPSGFHTVLSEDEDEIRDGVSPWQSVYREVGEELFGRQQVRRRMGRNETDPRGPDCKAVHWFRGKEHKVLHEIVSFGFDLIDGSFQFGILLVVLDPYFWDEFGRNAKANYEFKHPGREAIAVSTTEQSSISAMLSNPLCAQTSLAVLVPGLLRLKQIDSSRVNLPKLEITSPQKYFKQEAS